MEQEGFVKQTFDDTPFTAWFDRFADGQMHLGIWPDGEPEQTFGEAASRLTRLLMTELGVMQDHRILDVGCGPLAAPAIQLAREAGCIVDGVTLEDSAARHVPRRAADAGVADKVQVHIGSGHRLPFADHSFDGAWIIEMLIYVPDKASILREVHRVLRPGAKIVIADFPAVAPGAHELEWIRGNRFVPASFAEFERALADTGFVDIAARDLNAEVAIATFQRMNDHTKDKAAESRSVLGDEMYAVFAEALPQAVDAHSSGQMSYGVFTACKP